MIFESRFSIVLVSFVRARSIDEPDNVDLFLLAAKSAFCVDTVSRVRASVQIRIDAFVDVHTDRIFEFKTIGADAVESVDRFFAFIQSVAAGRWVLEALGFGWTRVLEVDLDKIGRGERLVKINRGELTWSGRIVDIWQTIAVKYQAQFCGELLLHIIIFG